VSYNVAQRTNEIGIRMALGAQRAGVIRMILRDVLTTALVGLAVGVPGALLASKLVRSFLYGIKPNDPLALAAAVGILLCAVLLAATLRRVEPHASSPWLRCGTNSSSNTRTISRSGRAEN